MFQPAVHPGGKHEHDKGLRANVKFMSSLGFVWEYIMMVHLAIYRFS